MSKIVNLEVELWHTLDIIKVGDKEEPSVILDLFVGASESPVLTDNITIRKMLDEYIDSHTIPNGTLRPEYRHIILKFLESIQSLVEEKIEEVMQIPDFNDKKKIAKKNTKPKSTKKSKKG